MDSKPNSHKLVLCKKPHEKRHIGTEENNIFNSVKIAILASRKGGNIEKSSKMADFLGKFRKAKK